MIAEVTFRIFWSEEGAHDVKILCGNVERDGLPVPIYMDILKALQQVEDKINGKNQQREELVHNPGIQLTHSGESLEEMGALRKDIEKYIDDQPPVSTPPHAENSSVEVG